MDDVRSFNIGASDYAQHKYQSWDFWITFVLNPFDADLCKRILRTKVSDGRLLDYQKIRHICGERIRQLEASNGIDLWRPIKYVSLDHFAEMIEDYNLCVEDKDLLLALLYNTFRLEAYKQMQEICDRRIQALQEKKN